MEDKTLVCRECGNEFVFTIGEQEFYAERGFENDPKRCSACREARKSGGVRKEFFAAQCARCGGEAKVPFQPRDDRPVYCSQCFAEIRGDGQSSGQRARGSQGFRGESGNFEN
jgi:CxxC-x17-CxxC domain-containing protein